MEFLQVYTESRANFFSHDFSQQLLTSLTGNILTSHLEKRKGGGEREQEDHRQK